MIITHVGFLANPINSPDRLETRALSAIVGQSFDIYAEAIDTNNAGASFSFQWSILNPRTGQTATVTNANQAQALLSNFAAVWGDVRVFCVATNTPTQETSESDPLSAPGSSFLTVELTSAQRSLTLPAIGARDWYKSSDLVTGALEALNIPQGISSAAVNNAGNLILTLSDASTIDAGPVVGADGADGADGAAGPAGPSQRAYMFNATLTHWFEPSSSTLHAGFSPTKAEVIAGPWLLPQNLSLKHISVSAQNGGPLSNAITFKPFTATQAGWVSNTISTLSLPVTLTASAANTPLTGYANTPTNSQITVTGGDVLGVLMEPSNVTGSMNQISVQLRCEEL